MENNGVLVPQDDLEAYNEWLKGSGNISRKKN